MTCVPADPQTKGGSEATVRISKADLVPTGANLLEAYSNFGTLVQACERFVNEVNARPHRERHRSPLEALSEERAHLHALPPEPYTAALDETRTVTRPDYSLRLGQILGSAWL